MLLDELLAEFRRRVQAHPATDPLESYVSAALALDERNDIAAGALPG